MKKLIRASAVFIFTAVMSLCFFVFGADAADEGKWISAWGVAPTEVGFENADLGMMGGLLGNVTVRSVITPTAEGTKLRVKYSNYYGKENLVIANATVAASMGDSKIATNTLRLLTFNGGRPGVTLKPGEEIYSDEVAFDVKLGVNIAVSTYVERFINIRSMGLSGGDTYFALAGEKGNRTDEEDFGLLSNLDVDKKLKVFLGSLIGSFVDLDPSLSVGSVKVVPVLAGIDVFNENPDAYSVAVIGDSTVANEFPLYLARAIHAQGITDVGISGKGLIGNQLLRKEIDHTGTVKGESLLMRMKRDILGIDGKNEANVKYVILKIGANDIMYPVCTGAAAGLKQPTADEIVNGYKQVIDFCHENGMKVIAVGITQWHGAKRDYFGTGVLYNREGQEFMNDWQIALDVNKKLASLNTLDGFVTYNDMSANPLDITSLNPDYTTDGIHPSRVLQKLWADSFPLSLLGVGNRTAGLTISDTEKTVFAGDAPYRLTASVIPANADNKAVTWSSSDEKIVKVDKYGNITGLTAGTATVTVQTVDSGYSGKGYSASCKVTVCVRPSSVTVSGKTSDTVYTGKSTKFAVNVLPSNAYSKEIVWTSSNTKVATVDSSGTVTGVGSGKATITAASKVNSKLKVSFSITVLKKVSVYAVILDETEKELYVGGSFTLKSDTKPDNATFPETVWTSSNSKVATVTSDGVVKAVKAGVAVITCKSTDNPMCKATCVVTVSIKAKSIKISKTSLNLYATQKASLTASVYPSNATEKRVYWTSSNKKVATVSSSGKITAKKAGTATITVKSVDGGYTAKCKVKVSKYVKVKKISLNTKKKTVYDGKKYTLKASFSPSKASNKGITWSSSNKKIATVSSKGVVTAKYPGTCTITAKSKDTGKTVKCKITVKRVRVKSVVFDAATYEVGLNKSLKLNAIVTPSNATNKKITWKSSNPKYASVSSSGTVKGLTAGKTVTITATTKDGKKVAKCKVKVITYSVKSIKLNKTSATTGVGGSVTLTPIITPSNASNTGVTWTSSDTKVATVSAKGVVTPVKDGTAVITCTTKEGGYTAKCTVTVKTIRPLGITLDKTSLYADLGAEFTLYATVVPSNTTAKKVIWSSTDTEVATVSADGTVRAVGEGVCYIKAKTSIGNYTAQCLLTVKADEE